MEILGGVVSRLPMKVDCPIILPERRNTQGIAVGKVSADTTFFVFVGAHSLAPAAFVMVLFLRLACIVDCVIFVGLMVAVLVFHVGGDLSGISIGAEASRDFDRVEGGFVAFRVILAPVGCLFIVGERSVVVHTLLGY